MWCPTQFLTSPLWSPSSLSYLIDHCYSSFSPWPPQSKLITPSALVERLKINGSLAREALKELKEKGLIKPVSVHHAQIIYTRAVGGSD